MIEQSMYIGVCCSKGIRSRYLLARQRHLSMLVEYSYTMRSLLYLPEWLVLLYSYLCYIYLVYLPIYKIHHGSAD